MSVEKISLRKNLHFLSWKKINGKKSTTYRRKLKFSSFSSSKSIPDFHAVLIPSKLLKYNAIQGQIKTKQNKKLQSSQSETRFQLHK